MRVLVALALVLAWASFGGAAAASCVQEDLPAKAARAEAVVHARVVALEGPPLGAPSRFAHFEVIRVLKGSALSRIGVALGPDVGGGAGPVAATSVDYAVQPGTEHTLFLRQHAPGGFSTDACSGSHPGGPTAEEVAFFGPGSAPDRAPAGIADATGTDRLIALAATVVALAAGVAAIVYARRSAREDAAAAT